MNRTTNNLRFVDTYRWLAEAVPVDQTPVFGWPNSGGIVRADAIEALQGHTKRLVPASYFEDMHKVRPPRRKRKR